MRRVAQAFVARRLVLRAIVATVVVFAAIWPAASPFVGHALAYTCTTYVYPPRDLGFYAIADAEAFCPAASEYKVLQVCLVKSQYGVIACRSDPGYQPYYYAGPTGCAPPPYNVGYYYTQATFTNQGTRSSPLAWIVC